MSFWKMAFEMSGRFRLIPKHLGTRDFSFPVFSPPMPTIPGSTEAAIAIRRMVLRGHRLGGARGDRHDRRRMGGRRDRAHSLQRGGSQSRRQAADLPASRQEPPLRVLSAAQFLNRRTDRLPPSDASRRIGFTVCDSCAGELPDGSLLRFARFRHRSQCSDICIVAASSWQA
jgi:hypothetical protein